MGAHTRPSWYVYVCSNVRIDWRACQHIIDMENKMLMNCYDDNNFTLFQAIEACCVSEPIFVIFCYHFFLILPISHNSKAHLIAVSPNDNCFYSAFFASICFVPISQIDRASQKQISRSITLEFFNFVSLFCCFRSWGEM